MNQLNQLIIEGVITTELENGFCLESKNTFKTKESVIIDVIRDDYTGKRKLKKGDVVRIIGHLKQIQVKETELKLYSKIVLVAEHIMAENDYNLENDYNF